MTIRFTTLFLTAALAVPGVAAAKPGNRDFQRTFPVASRLCKAVDNGHTPRRIKRSAEQVAAACATLHSSYDAAVAAAGASTDVGRREARRTYRQAIQAARKAFWTTLDGLRGDGSLRPDRPQHDEPAVDEPANDEPADEPSDEPTHDEPADDVPADEAPGDDETTDES